MGTGFFLEWWNVLEFIALSKRLSWREAHPDSDMCPGFARQGPQPEGRAERAQTTTHRGQLARLAPHSS